MIGVTSTPASAPIPADMAKDSVITKGVLIPTSCAASRLFDVARTARPRSVRVKNIHSPMNTATEPAITHRLCGRIVAPKMRIGSSPEKAGKVWICLPNTSCAAPRIKIEAPMVMMTSDTTGAPRAGSMASLFIATPIAAVATTAASAASGSGAPAV